MDQDPYLRKKFDNMKCQRVKVDESFVPALEDEAIEVEHLLAEPKSDHVSVDGVLCLGKENSRKCLEMGKFSCGFDYGMNTNCGGLDSNIIRGGEDDLKLEILDGLLDEVDEVDDIHAASDFSNACEDFLLDIEFAEKISELDFGPCDGSRLGNSSSESNSPGFSGSSNGAIGVSESSTTIPESESKNDSLDNVVNCELHGIFVSKCGCQAPVEDSMRPTSYDLHSQHNLDNDTNPLVNCTLSDENEKCSVKSIKVGTFLRQKRLRKPTRRYIEEFSDLKSRYLMGRQKISTTIPKDKCLKVRSHNELHHVRALALVPREDSRETITQASFESRVQRGRPKKHSPISELESDDELSASESEDDHMAKKRSKHGVDRRKHQRMWTISEVMKLVDGISQYGVGRWTDIKRLLFSSSAYRTPVDLRDKWRNLLRASCTQKKTRREMEQKLKHALRPLPKSVLHRIRELATIHPYPRVRNSKISTDGHVDVPTLPTVTKGDPFSLSGRNGRRKNCT